MSAKKSGPSLLSRDSNFAVGVLNGQEMRNVHEQFLCCVLDVNSGNHSAFNLGGESSVQDLYEEVARRFENINSFNLSVKRNDNSEPYCLQNVKPKSLKDVGFQADNQKNHILLDQKQTMRVKDKKDDAGGFSGSAEGPLSSPPDPPPPPPTATPPQNNWPPVSHQVPLAGSSNMPFVGLVNQAMTCYLNSLLQALFMTPEFRNAMYHWVSNDTAGSGLPLELQKLFLKLQTSDRTSVETTALTKSFGWNSSEAWQQHDIQELCRLLFDALERQFKGTDQADLINRLYEGTMLDYVKCLECCTERHREDKFLDIPLPVRPFGAHAAYNSIEEALRAFVQPETLDGNNQYHCDKCNKKCDAHKGLKFTKLPYLLTLHLKRFDFDYHTLNRIKLNDKVTFPYVLNLNAFVKKSNGEGDVADEVVKNDDCSTTDSGSALDEDNAEPPVTNSHSDLQDEDEGIDMNSTVEAEKIPHEDGPYSYELFSIMIHSGSASGGHYYAYIKDFTSGQWFCFNDQSVYKIKTEDIERTYGGGTRYTSYSSSTNAYMLMYRQIDRERNVLAMTKEQFPPHLHKQLALIEEQKEIQYRIQQNEKFFDRRKCYYRRENGKEISKELRYNKEDSLGSVLKTAIELFYIGEPEEQCRLVMYDSVKKVIECSFEGREDEKLTELLLDGYQGRELLLQVRAEDEKFTTHRIGDITVKIMKVDPVSGDFEIPICLPTNENYHVGTFRGEVADVLHVPINDVHLYISQFNTIKPLDEDEKTLKEAGALGKERVYVYCGPPCDLSSVDGVISRAIKTVSLHIKLPLVTKEILETYDIQPRDDSRDSPLPSLEECTYLATDAGALSDQSASEDSSLTSDSERTIVPGTMQSSPDGSPTSSMQPLHLDFNSDNKTRGCDSDQDAKNPCFKYYKHLDNNSGPNALVEKDVRLVQFKNFLEPLVGVSSENMKIMRQSGGCEQEWSQPTKTLSMASDGDVVTVRLCRAPRPGETTGKVFLLSLQSDERERYLFDWAIANGTPVSLVKKEIATEAKKKCGLDLPLNRCRLRRKGYLAPDPPLLDSALITDLQSNWEMYIQELDDGEVITDPVSQRLVLVRRWCPSTRTLTPYTEYSIDSDAIIDLAKMVSEKAKIPFENLELAEFRGKFQSKDPTEGDIHSGLKWKPADDINYVSSGTSTFYVRDKTENLMQGTDDKRLARKDKYSGYQKREQALRICAEPKEDDAEH